MDIVFSGDLDDLVELGVEKWFAVTGAEGDAGSSRSRLKHGSEIIDAQVCQAIRFAFAVSPEAHSALEIAITADELEIDKPGRVQQLSVLI